MWCLFPQDGVSKVGSLTHFDNYDFSSVWRSMDFWIIKEGHSLTRNWVCRAACRKSEAVRVAFLGEALLCWTFLLRKHSYLSFCKINAFNLRRQCFNSQRHFSYWTFLWQINFKSLEISDMTVFSLSGQFIGLIIPVTRTLAEQGEPVGSHWYLTRAFTRIWLHL